MDLDSFLNSLYVLVDDWWKADRCSKRRGGPGRPTLLSDTEVLTLAILAQWPRFRSERDFWRFADAHLRPYFPSLLSQSRLNRHIRELEPELRALQRGTGDRHRSRDDQRHKQLATLRVSPSCSFFCLRGSVPGTAKTRLTACFTGRGASSAVQDPPGLPKLSFDRIRRGGTAALLV